MRSSWSASGVSIHANEFWSSTDASQSAPSAAGVTPPVTKWKFRGPAEATVPSSAGPVSRASVSSAPWPCSGIAP